MAGWLSGQAPAPARLDLAITGLRSEAGVVQICVTASERHFPDCAGDPSARRITVPAAAARNVEIAGLAPGDYAVSLFHDENGNGRLDTRLKVPLEGVGFSNNPRLIFGPPSFAHARIHITAPATAATIEMKYFF